jgi:hypothetical protein
MIDKNAIYNFSLFSIKGKRLLRYRVAAGGIAPGNYAGFIIYILTAGEIGTISCMALVYELQELV